MSYRNWTTGIYEATPNFKQIENHACVCRADDGLLVATCGPAEDQESQKDACLMATAPKLLAACESIAKIIAEQMFTDYFERNLNYCLKTELWPAIAEAKGEK